MPDVADTVTMAEAARRLRLAPVTVRTLVHRGTLATVETADGSKLVAVVEVERYAADRRPPGRPEKTSTHR